uniref:Uncharacterized protein n=1 Tax=Arundo donax TaxID=35708 RepID=A0A0A9CHR3_ARUDO
MIYPSPDWLWLIGSLPSSDCLPCSPSMFLFLL